MSAPLLEACEVQAHHSNRPVLERASLSIKPGQLWAALGPNGAGKSTLLRCCLGLHPLSGGTLRLFGTQVDNWKRRELAQQLAWVPQTVEWMAGFTALELVLMGRSPHQGLWALPSPVDLRVVEALFEELELTALAARPVEQLSGGEQRLVLLARALAQEPKLLLLDEPTAFLDLRHQVAALACVRRRVDLGLGVLAVLHDVNLAAGFADHALLLRGGAVLASGPTSGVLSTLALEALYGVPMFAAEQQGQTLYFPRLPR